MITVTALAVSLLGNFFGLYVWIWGNYCAGSKEQQHECYTPGEIQLENLGTEDNKKNINDNRSQQQRASNVQPGSTRNPDLLEQKEQDIHQINEEDTKANIVL